MAIEDSLSKIPVTEHFNAFIDGGRVSEGNVQVCPCLLAIPVRQFSTMPTGSFQKDRKTTSHGQSST